MARLTINDFAEMLNEECDSFQYYFACELAKSIKAILPSILGQLNEQASLIAEHYIEEGIKCTDFLSSHKP